MSEGGSPEAVKEEGRSPASSPVMLTTMTPVSVIEYEQQAHQDHKIIYVHNSEEAAAAAMMMGGGGGGAGTGSGPTGPGGDADHGFAQDLEGGSSVSVLVQEPAANVPVAYQGGPGTTVLVLSELVEDMSPLLGLRYLWLRRRSSVPCPIIGKTIVNYSNRI